MKPLRTLVLLLLLVACAAPAPTAQPTAVAPAPSLVANGAVGGCTITISPDQLSGSWSCPEQTATPTATATSTETETPTPTETATLEPTPTPEPPTSTPTSPISPSEIVPPPTSHFPPPTSHFPFGPLALPDAQYSSGQFNAAAMLFRTRHDPLASLALAKANGLHVWIGMTSPQVKDAAGRFDLAAWEAQLDASSVNDIQPYLDDGTIVALAAVDEPQDATSYGGAPVPYDQLEAACTYLKYKWPALRCAMYTEATWLDAAPPGAFHNLDAVITQYTVTKGDLDTFIAGNAAAAQHLGITLYFAINFLGGDAGRTNVTAAHLLDWGSRMLAEPSACGLTGWTWDPTYFAQPDVLTATAGLKLLADARASC